MNWSLPDPMLTANVDSPLLPPGWAVEPKWDGFRALLSVDTGRVVLRSRRGTDMAPAFPEIVAGGCAAAGRDRAGRRAGRMGRRGPPRVRAVAEPACPARRRAARAAEEWPAHFVAFDLLRLSGTDTTGWPYRRRRAALESLFTARQLTAPWTLYPSTTEAGVVRELLTWASVGMEGSVFRSHLIW
ncbi:hypothetical protein WJ438_03250 [Streptomyces sp. GD-15H]|uniref:hypothetical protein n=1 Tax=Streptomyces sp. GD-15H TaxID=3129112 RepID=UPI00324BAE81